jgi:crotonobetainyl-CoA:carnitine CoA-transferase CaiB-like acyl-CoA transferase
MSARLQAVFLQRERDEWLEILGDTPCVGPVNDVAEALRDSQVQHRGMVAEIDGIAVGPSSPLKFGGMPGSALRPAPGLGEHTAEVLASVGVGTDELSELRVQGVI